MDKALNEQVAIEVMGWRFDEDWGCLVPPEQKAKPSEMWTGWKEGVDEDGSNYTYKEPVDENHVLGVVYTHGHKEIRLPDYSGDMSEAWKVVEKVVDDWGCIFRVEKMGVKYAGATWSYHVKLTGGNLVYSNSLLDLDVYAASGPEAVCRAALRAVRGQRG